VCDTTDSLDDPGRVEFDLCVCVQEGERNRKRERERERVLAESDQCKRVKA